MFRRGAAIAICSALLFALAPAHGAERETPKPAAATDAAMPEAKPAPPLAYITVAGAPGDGEQALAAALGKRLSVSRREDRERARYDRLFGGRHREDDGGKRRQGRPYASTGRSSGPTATTLGGVSQTKLVRKGSLDRKWGVAADAAARAAATAHRQAHLAHPAGLAEGP